MEAGLELPARQRDALVKGGATVRRQRIQNGFKVRARAVIHRRARLLCVLNWVL